ncbi:hypothetical protein BDR07DRAFT_46578 [Suillus spraguei]|nr:hypothetical protein BDR07DRAFT_46578 [Suillus spraguei]
MHYEHINCIPQTSLWRHKRWIRDIVMTNQFHTSTILSIKAYNIYGYFTVAASVGIIYDWALTFEQEVELFWKRRWSLVSILYLSIRYVGIVYVVLRC